MNCCGDPFVKGGKPKSNSLGAKFLVVAVACDLASCGILYKEKGVEKPSRVRIEVGHYLFLRMWLLIP